MSRRATPIRVSLTLFEGPYYHRNSGSASIFGRGRNSVVECLLPKQDVVGSNPIARSIPLFPSLSFRRVQDLQYLLSHVLPRPTVITYFHNTIGSQLAHNPARAW